MDGFTLLIFGLCAKMSILEAQPVVSFWHVAAGMCVVHTAIGDSHGETAQLEGHEIGVRLLDGGASITVDGQMFTLQSTSEATT